MNRYKFSEEEIPYGILEQFGLRREMIGDLPVDVLQAIHSGRRSPVLPICVNDSEGNTIHARTRFSLVRREDGTADVLFYPVLVESRLERFSEEQKQRLMEGKAVIAPMPGDNDTPVQAFHQIDSGTKQILSVPTPVIGRNLQIIADEFHLSIAEINCLRVGEPLTVAKGDELMTIGIDLNEQAKREWDKYNFGCFGCWVADGEGGLDYVHEDDYNEEMWNELKRSSQRRMQNANTPKL